jgi:TonB family protein
MSRRTKQRARRNGWSWAVGASCVAHAILLAALARGGVVDALRPAPESVTVELAPDPACAPTAAQAAAALPDPPPTVDETVVARPLDARQGDRDNAVPTTVAPRVRVDDGRDRAAPAPDEGASGAARSVRASRRDRSELQSRVADARDAAQPSRLRTSAHTSSPQAERREAKTGLGDSVRTSEATRAPSAAAPDSPPGPDPAAAPDVAAPAAGAKVAARVLPPTLTRASDHPTPDTGAGPLAAERGARTFDAPTPGRAADDETDRAAANAAHPGITDYSHAGVAGPANTREGRGPGDAPGAVARATTGTAPSVAGARDAQALAAELAERTRARIYDHYRQEIQRRVQSVLVFPKPLALRLEQGEAVVTFVVRPDGALGEGPRLVKSSGFEEFDTEAVKAVLRAAPFPRRPDASGLFLSMPVTFENPLVR